MSSFAPDFPHGRRHPADVGQEQASDRKPNVGISASLLSAGKAAVAPNGVPMPPLLEPFHPHEAAALAADMQRPLERYNTLNSSGGVSEVTASPSEAKLARCLSQRAGCIHVCGPDGALETLYISAADSPEAIERCLRAAFGMPYYSEGGSRPGAAYMPLLLRDEYGRAVPLGPTLLGDAQGQAAGDYPTYWVKQPAAKPHLDCAAPAGMRDAGRAPSGSLLSEHLRGRYTLAEGESDSWSGPSTWPVPPVHPRPLAINIEPPSEASVPHFPNQTEPALSHIASVRSENSKACLPNAVALNGGGILDDNYVEVCTKSIPAATILPTPEWMSTMALQDEFTFWTELASKRRGWDEIRNHLEELETSSSKKHATSTLNSEFLSTQTEVLQGRNAKSFRSRLEQLQQSAMLDTCPQHIERLYKSWAQKDGILRRETLLKRLDKRCGISLTEEELHEALERVQRRFSGPTNFPGRPHDGPAQPPAGSRAVTPQVFASLWQRLALGTICYASHGEAHDSVGTIEMIEYDEHCISGVGERIPENKLLFGGRQRDRHVGQVDAVTHPAQRSAATRWAIIDSPSQALIKRLGVKFWLHPLAVEDAINAASLGTTKIDRYRHQYFISLEVYAYQDFDDVDELSGIDRLESSARFAYSARLRRPLPRSPVEVGPRITRSTVSFLATGNPPTSSHTRTTRDWMLAIVNNPERQIREDPLDRFDCNRMAARKIIRHIKDDLISCKRQREYQADFLLYSVIHRAVSEMTPIYNAYGRRLRWMQDELDLGKLSDPQEYVEEVARVRLELQQLRQWSGQLKTIVHHLEGDCRGTTDAANEMLWNFGADSRGQGKSMLIFLRHTQDDIDQVVDRLSVLDDVAANFTAAIDRLKSNFMNQILFLLTGATTVFLPAQFLAGVYGMNFVGEDGEPAVPELTWGKEGYLFFWIMAGTMFVTGVVVVLCAMKCPALRKHRGQGPLCCPCCKRRKRA